MIAQQLKSVFDPFIHLDLSLWENFEKLGVVKELPKSTVLKEAHTTEKYLNFVVKGSGGNLIWNRHHFVCIDLAFDGEFLNDYMSFILQKPTPIEVRLFEDSTLLQIPYQNFQKTLTPGNIGEKIVRIANEIAYIDKQYQQIDLLTKTAKERYLELVSKKEGAARIPLQYLASYLGITPQSLSRIRSQKL